MANRLLEGTEQVVWESGPWMLAVKSKQNSKNIIQVKLKPDLGTRVQFVSLIQGQLDRKEYSKFRAKHLGGGRMEYIGTLQTSMGTQNVPL